jgi:hypothetical protein
MIHSKCKEQIQYLREALAEEREQNRKLQRQLLEMKHEPEVVARIYPSEPGSVRYVDDDRMVELEATSK